MTFQSQLNFPIKKLHQGPLSNSFNSKKQNVSAKRALFKSMVSESSPKKSRQDENFNENIGSVKATLRSENASSYVMGKNVFHTDQLTKLVGRSEEISKISTFIRDHIEKQEAGSMYISGVPGTGKTTCLMSVIQNWEKPISYAFVNCMSNSNPCDIYKSIAREFKLSSKIVNSKNIVKALEKHIVTSSSMNVLILDEMDHLDCKGQEILYSLFEWPHLPESSLILIGIANAIDLPDRMLPRLHASKYKPKWMNFKPYNKDQIVHILEHRLLNLQGSTTIIKPLALELCARKVAACTGDIRKALNVCSRAIEMVQNKQRMKITLKSTSDDRSNSGSPMKKSLELCVDVPDISAVLNEIYGSRLQLPESSKTLTMPVQQMILLCTLILMKRNCKIQDMNLGKLYDIYRRVCKKRDIIAVNEWEFNGLCKLVEARGLIQLKPSKVVRMTKVALQIDEAEAELILQDKVMLPSILFDKSVLCKH